MERREDVSVGVGGCLDEKRTDNGRLGLGTWNNKTTLDRGRVDATRRQLWERSCSRHLKITGIPPASGGRAALRFQPFQFQLEFSSV